METTGFEPAVSGRLLDFHLLRFAPHMTYFSSPKLNAKTHTRRPYIARARDSHRSDGLCIRSQQVDRVRGVVYGRSNRSIDSRVVHLLEHVEAMD